MKVTLKDAERLLDQMGGWRASGEAVLKMAAEARDSWDLAAAAVPTLEFLRRESDCPGHAGDEAMWAGLGLRRWIEEKK